MNELANEMIYVFWEVFKQLENSFKRDNRIFCLNYIFSLSSFKQLLTQVCESFSTQRPSQKRHIASAACPHLIFYIGRFVLRKGKGKRSNVKRIEFLLHDFTRNIDRSFQRAFMDSARVVTKNGGLLLLFMP